MRPHTLQGELHLSMEAHLLGHLVARNMRLILINYTYGQLMRNCYIVVTSNYFIDNLMFSELIKLVREDRPGVMEVRGDNSLSYNIILNKVI